MPAPREPQVRAPRRREKVLEIQAWTGTLRFRVHAPPPLEALGVLSQVTTILGPQLVRVIGGQVRLAAKASCPVCGHDDPEAVNGDRWLCPPERGQLTEEQAAKHEAQGPAVWDREWLRDDAGQVRRLTMALALSDPAWMGRLAQAVIDRMAAMALGKAETRALVCDLLVDALEFQQPGGSTWLPIRDAEQLNAQVAECEDGAAALLRLAAAALETWVFPMVRGAFSGTPRDTTETETAGASTASAPTSPGRARGLPRTATRSRA